MDISYGTTYTIHNGDVDPYTRYKVSLIAGNTYSVWMKTVNSMGDSLPVDSSNVVPYDVPTSPTIQNINVTSGTLFLYFTPPSTNNGSNILGYKYSLNGGGYIFSDASSSPIIITNGITNGISYYANLVATNLAGDSLPSNQSNTVKPIDNSQIPVVIKQDASQTTANKTVNAILGDVISVSNSGTTSNSAVPKGAISSSQYVSIKALFSSNV
jgi:hypothetical protein